MLFRSVGGFLGYVLGTLVARVGIPSFVVTLAAFLAFQGLLLLLAGEGGTIRIEDKTILAVENSNLSPTASWLFYLLVAIIYVLTGLRNFNTRKKAGLKTELIKLWVIKTTALLTITGIAVYALNVERSNNPSLVSLKGIPYVVPLIMFILAVGTFEIGRAHV